MTKHSDHYAVIVASYTLWPPDYKILTVVLSATVSANHPTKSNSDAIQPETKLNDEIVEKRYRRFCQHYRSSLCATGAVLYTRTRYCHIPPHEPFA